MVTHLITPISRQATYFFICPSQAVQLFRRGKEVADTCPKGLLLPRIANCYYSALSYYQPVCLGKVR